ncbi:uncharacterized protein LOC105423758 [Pogonomyrmex barbatus]|uniref:Uncharacterized protein LOC105423758 n=1 Tax=Pogonomyrmex barbatus TaxID=144034 RepID=A0A6I9WJQ7_9HYME|nr:uncharacterized protein LOC105423758 [Pogonomyrmex barbatus]
MDEIIRSVSEIDGYRRENHTLRILCYADDAALLAETENDLQRFLYKFKTTAEKFNMIMLIGKTAMVMKFNYLRIETASDRNITEEVRTQAIKAARISGYLRDIIWRNQHISARSKIRIYKTCVRPILTYIAETRAETSKTKRIMRATKIKILRTIKV